MKIISICCLVAIAQHVLGLISFLNSFSISYTMLHFVHAGVHTNPVERHPKLSPYFDRHVSRGDLLSLAFGHYPLPWLFRLRLLLPSTTLKNTILVIISEKKTREIPCLNPFYVGIGRWLFCSRLVSCWLKAARPFQVTLDFPRVRTAEVYRVNCHG